MKKREDLIGLTGKVTRDITIIDAKEQEDGTIDIRVTDSMGETFWTQLDGEIDINS